LFLIHNISLTNNIQSRVRRLHVGASHVRNAIGRFDQVKDVTDHEREQAFANIKAAAKHYGVDMTETHWQDLGKKLQTTETAGGVLICFWGWP